MVLLFSMDISSNARLVIDDRIHFHRPQTRHSEAMPLSYRRYRSAHLASIVYIVRTL